MRKNEIIWKKSKVLISISGLIVSKKLKIEQKNNIRTISPDVFLCISNHFQIIMNITCGSAAEAGRKKRGVPELSLD